MSCEDCKNYEPLQETRRLGGLRKVIEETKFPDWWELKIEPSPKGQRLVIVDSRDCCSQKYVLFNEEGD